MLISTKLRFSSGPGSGDIAVLWAAIAYAKFQHRAINNIPRALGSVGEMVWTAERMYAQARSLVPNEEGTLDIGTFRHSRDSHSRGRRCGWDKKTVPAKPIACLLHCDYFPIVHNTFFIPYIVNEI